MGQVSLESQQRLRIGESAMGHSCAFCKMAHLIYSDGFTPVQTRFFSLKATFCFGRPDFQNNIPWLPVRVFIAFTLKDDFVALRHTRCHFKSISLSVVVHLAASTTR